MKNELTRSRQTSSKTICPKCSYSDPLYKPIFDKIFTQYSKDKSRNKYRIPFKEVLANGIWQIIKFQFDEQIADRRIVDSSISQPDGSLQAQFYKICQEPFVEFFSDTYGDMFYFIVRQPPFTGEAITEYLNKRVPISKYKYMSFLRALDKVSAE